jgi:hypothetical protein
MDDEKYLELVEHVWNSFLLFEEEEETYLTPDEFNEIIQVMHDFLQNVSGEE